MWIENDMSIGNKNDNVCIHILPVRIMFDGWMCSVFLLPFWCARDHLSSAQPQRTKCNTRTFYLFAFSSTLLMFVICTSRLVIEHKSICMTTIQWHKNVNTLEVDMHRVHFYKSRKTSCANTFEWYSNRLDVYYLAFYWKVLMLFFPFAYSTHA